MENENGLGLIHEYGIYIMMSEIFSFNNIEYMFVGCLRITSSKKDTSHQAKFYEGRKKLNLHPLRIYEFNSSHMIHTGGSDKDRKDN